MAALPRLVRFGLFELDRSSGELRRSGVRVKLQEQPFRVLEVLLENPGEVVTREEFCRRLWPDLEFGDFDHALNVAIKKLRDALGDVADNPRFVETLARRGYRFIGPVEVNGHGSTDSPQSRQDAKEGLSPQRRQDAKETYSPRSRGDAEKEQGGDSNGVSVPAPVQGSLPTPSETKTESSFAPSRLSGEKPSSAPPRLRGEGLSPASPEPQPDSSASSRLSGEKVSPLRGKGLLRRAAIFAAGATVLFLLFIVGVSIYRFDARRRSQLHVEPFTNYVGLEQAPAFSPDGTKLAFLWDGDRGGPFHVYVKPLHGGHPVQLTQGDDGDLSPQWSPDGAAIAYIRSGREGGIYTVAAAGGVPARLLAFPLARDLSWTPDGKGMAFSAQEGPGAASIAAVYMFHIGDHPGESKAWRLVSPSAAQATAVGNRAGVGVGAGGGFIAGDSHVAFSPDGNLLAFVRQPDANGGASIMLLPLRGGEARPISSDSLAIGGIAWAAGGRELIFSARRAGRNAFELWRMPLSGGRPERLPVGDEVLDPAVGPHGRIAFRQMVVGSAIWRYPLAAEPPSSQRSGPRAASVPSQNHDQNETNNQNSNQAQNKGPAPAHSGAPFKYQLKSDAKAEKFELKRGDGGAILPPQQAELNRLRAALDAQHVAQEQQRARSDAQRTTDDPRHLTQDARPAAAPLISSTRAQVGPQYSPDGTKIAFASNRTGKWEIWVANADGSNPAQLTFFQLPETGTPRWSPDGRSLAFDSRPAGNAQVFVLDLAGGLPRAVTSADVECVVPSWSANGKWLYFSCFVNSKDRYEIFRRPAPAAASSGSQSQSPSSSASPRLRGENSAARDPKASEQVTQDGGFSPFESPDGRYLYYAKFDRPGLFRRALGPESAVNGAQPSPYVPFVAKVAPLDPQAAVRGVGDPSQGPPAAPPAPPALRGPTEKPHGPFARRLGQAAQPADAAGQSDIARRTTQDARPVEELVVAALPEKLWAYWAITPSGLYYLAADSTGGEWAIFHLDLTTERTTRLFALDRQPKPGGGLAVSPDQQSILVTQIERTGSDIMLAEGVR